MFQVGDRIGDYEILQILGAGGMGQVYKVRNSLSDRIEAMKVLLPELVGDPQLADRFLREIKVQASLVHKNIAQLYTARREGDQLVMLLEFVDGLTLDGLLRRGPLNTNALVSLFSQVLDALAFAHSHGVVHRDIKPQNIMVTADGTAKLMDFGIARMSQDQRLTQTGRTLGSLYYMSPEQIRGLEDIDGRSDLYSLGVTLYEAAIGSRPFDGSSDYSIMAAHLQESAVPPVDRDRRLPRILSDVIMAAIEKDRDQRFQSAAAFKAALQHVVGGGAAASAVSDPVPASDATLIGPPPPMLPKPVTPLPAPPPISSQPVLPAVSPQPATPPPPPMPPPPQQAEPNRSKAGLMMGLGAIAFATIAGVGVWQYPRMFGTTGTPAAATSTVSPPAASTAVPELQTAQPVPERVKNPVIMDQKQPQQQPSRPPVKVMAVDQAPPPPLAQTQQQRPAVVEQQQPPLQRQQQSQQPVNENPPAASPEVMREIQLLRQRYNHLQFRLAGCKDTIDAQGPGLRTDLRDANRLARERLREVQTALHARDIEAARQNLDLAERSVEYLAKGLGR